MKRLGVLVFCAVHTVILLASAEPDAAAISPKTLANRLSELQEGSSYVRLRMENKQPTGGVLQLQIKARRSKTSSEVVYQILWPKERKGESVLLRKSGKGSASGVLFVPPDTEKALSASDMKEPLFGSALAYEDVIDNFFTWENQAIIGTEKVDGVECQILESKPGKSDRSSYVSVRTWVDGRRLVPLRVEKYSSPGQLARRIETTNITQANLRFLPTNLVVRGPGNAVSDLDGSKIRYDVRFADGEFTAEGLREVAVPKSAR